MQIVTRSLQTINQALTVTGQKLSQIDTRIVKAAAFIFAAVVLYLAYRKISAYHAEVDQINRDHVQQPQGRRNALIARLEQMLLPNPEYIAARDELRAAIRDAKRMLVLTRGGIEAAILKSKEAVLGHLRPVIIEENDYVHTIGDDKKEGIKIPRHIADLFNHGEKWTYGTKTVENPLTVYKWLLKDIGEEKAIRCLNVCAYLAWKPSLAPIAEQVDLNQANVKEHNVVTVDNQIFKVLTVMQFFHKNGGERFSYLVRTVELDVRDLQRDDVKVPSLNVTVRYPKQT